MFTIFSPKLSHTMERKNINEFLKDANIVERMDKDIPLNICYFDNTYIWSYKNRYILCSLDDDANPCKTAIRSIRSCLKKKYVQMDGFESLKPFLNDDPPSDILKQRIMIHLFHGWQFIFDNTCTINTSRDAIAFVNKIEPFTQQLVNTISSETFGLSFVDSSCISYKYKASLKVLYDEVLVVHKELGFNDDHSLSMCEKTNVMLKDVLNNCTAETYYKYESQSCEMKIHAMRINKTTGLYYSKVTHALNKLLRVLISILGDDEKVRFFKNLIQIDSPKVKVKTTKVHKRRSKRLFNKSTLKPTRIIHRLSLVINKRTSKTVHVRRSTRISNSKKLIIN